MLVKVENSIASFSGNPESLGLFIKGLENLSLLWDNGEMQHFHFDPQTNEFLSPESRALSLVIVIK